MTISSRTRLVAVVALGVAVAGGGALAAQASTSSHQGAAIVKPVTKPAPAKPAPVQPAHGKARFSPLAEVTVINECLPDQGVQQPASFTLACADGSASLTQLSWSGWGADTATATGLARVNTCDPSCVAGALVDYPVTVIARGLFDREGSQVYTYLSYTFTGAVPTGFDRTETMTLPR